MSEPNSRALSICRQHRWQTRQSLFTFTYHNRQSATCFKVTATVAMLVIPVLPVKWKALQISVNFSYHDYFLKDKLCCINQVPPGQSSRLTAKFFIHKKLYATTGFKTERENVGFFRFPAGSYVILPVTSYFNVEGKYLIRIFTSEKCKVR